MQVAKYYGVPPWELIDKPFYWHQVGLICMAAENEYQKYQHEQAQKKAKQRAQRR